MPGDINVIDPLNSTSTPLVGDGTFTGEFVDVTDYTSISVSVNSDVRAAVRGLILEWSADGITAHQKEPFDYPGPISTGTIGEESNGITVHVTIRMQFYRIRYTNDFEGQTFFELQSLLRKGTPVGNIIRVAPEEVFFSRTLDGQVALAVTAMQDYFNSQFLIPYCEDGTGWKSAFSAFKGGLMWVVPPGVENDNLRTTTTSASLGEAILDSSIGRSIRQFVSLFNDSVRATLFIKLAASDETSGVSPTDFHYRIPAQHTWVMPPAWGGHDAKLTGAWDIVQTGDKAICCEALH
jgi:hypothetical protein